MEYLVGTYGYVGIFATMAITSATIILPVPGYLAIIFAGPFLNLYLVAVVAGLGAALGELTGYLLGLGGRKIIGEGRKLETAKSMYSRYGVWSIYIFAATPLPFDFIGIICGILKIDWKIFFLLTLAGKTTLFMILAETGKLTFDTIEDIMAGQVTLSAIPLILIILVSIIPIFYWKWRLNQEKR